ncbi:MAG: MFS transporter [Bdellovibrionales bacterium]|nr:MFS transporter [Bdellovibrionales bacterium]
MRTTFWSFFWIQFLGSFVDNFIKSFLVVFVVYHSITLLGMDESKLVPFSGFLFVLPFFLFSTHAGLIASKFQRKKLIQYVKFFELTLVIFALISFLEQCWGCFFVIVFLQGVQSTFFGPIKYSIIPDYVRAESLLQANGWVELGTFISILLGTIMGTRSIAFIATIPWAFYLLLLVPSLLGFLLSFTLKEVPIENPHTKINSRFLSSIFSEMKTFFHRKEIFSDIQAISFFWFNGMWILSLIPLLTKNVWQAPEALLTFFLSLFTIGIGLGSLLCYKIQSKITTTTYWTTFQLLFLSVLFFVLGFIVKLHKPYVTLQDWITVPQHIIIMICMFLFSFSMGLYIVPLYTSLQLDAPLMLRSKAIANNNIYNALYMTLSSLTFIVLTKWLSYPYFFFCLGLINLIFLFYLFPKKSY